MRFEFGVFVDHPIEFLGVFGLDLFAIAIVPPIIDASPWPLRDVEDIVAEHRHAFIESDRDSANRCAHQGNRNDADDDAERGER